MKAIKYIIISALVLIAIIFVCWNLAPGWITSELSKKMGVEVTIGHIGLGTKKVSAKNIRIVNPKGYKFRDALRVKSLITNTSLFTFLKKKIVIEEIQGNDIYLDLEFDRKGRSTGNWSVIMGNLDKSIDEDSRKEKKKDNKSVLIKLIVLRDITIDLVYKRENEVRRLKPIKKIVLRNISSDEAFPTAQLTNIIMNQMLKEVFSINNLTNMLKNILNPNSSGGVLTPLKGLFSIEVEHYEDPQEAE
jgi:uncharacterized protein involved in outer membrane biogenesis